MDFQFSLYIAGSLDNTRLLFLLAIFLFMFFNCYIFPVIPVTQLTISQYHKSSWQALPAIINAAVSDLGLGVMALRLKHQNRKYLLYSNISSQIHILQVCSPVSEHFISRSSYNLKSLYSACLDGWNNCTSIPSVFHLIVNLLHLTVIGSCFFVTSVFIRLVAVCRNCCVYTYRHTLNMWLQLYRSLEV